ncbi:hypothetical protein BDDG_11644 [Blastomyces dermatitidis ATCC 18188]|uniref:Uncharacterized protein n=1 Tax=Ajellomyces dermatitidis (strain ATCC 18188 / CBS 674.68) TaxID=653446 RepID=A0A0J9EJU4_AJEDA|nr:hypothetical protein BDDG_11644 [Blastomyces dermatitidis ATCC 18188]
MVMKRAGNELNTDELISRRDDISLQDTATTAAAVKKAGEEEDMTMKAVLSQLIDIIISAFNLAFLMVMEAVITSQRHLLLTRKHQNKFLIVL